MESADWGAYSSFHVWRNELPGLASVMQAARLLGSYPVLGLVLLAALLGLAARRRRRSALFLLVLVLASSALAELLKLAIPRDRPPDWDHEALFSLPGTAALSFPSAAALVSLVVYGALAVLLARAAGPWPVRLLVWAGAALLVLLAGASQLFVGAHFLSDVLAGWAAGLAVLLAGCALALPDVDPKGIGQV